MAVLPCNPGLPSRHGRERCTPGDVHKLKFETGRPDATACKLRHTSASTHQLVHPNSRLDFGFLAGIHRAESLGASISAWLNG